jgi:hypothetical protein
MSLLMMLVMNPKVMCKMLYAGLTHIAVQRQTVTNRAAGCCQSH